MGAVGQMPEKLISGLTWQLLILFVYCSTFHIKSFYFPLALLRPYEALFLFNAWSQFKLVFIIQI